MKNTDGEIQYMKDWYGFYKSINTKNNTNKWLIDFALDYYQKKLSNKVYQNQNNESDNTIYDLPDVNLIPQTYYSNNNPSSNQQI